MKKIITICIVCLVALGFTGCSKESTNENKYIENTPTSDVFKSDFESIKEIMACKKDDVIKMLGKQYVIVKSADDDSEDRYYYEKYGVTVVFDESIKDTEESVVLVVCDNKVNVKGAKLGMTFSEIEGFLGVGTKRELIKYQPDDASYAEYYLIDDLMIWFAADTEDGQTTKLEIRRYSGPK